MIALFAVGIAFGVTAVMAGLGNRKALHSALTTAAIGVVAWFPLQVVFDDDGMNIWRLFGLGIVAIVVGSVVGYAYGGFDKGMSARTSAVVALVVVNRDLRRPGDAVVGRVLVELGHPEPSDQDHRRPRATAGGQLLGHRQRHVQPSDPAHDWR